MSRIHLFEINYQRSACDMNRMDGKSYESVSEGFDMSSKGEGMAVYWGR